MITSCDEVGKSCKTCKADKIRCWSYHAYQKGRTDKAVEQSKCYWHDIENNPKDLPKKEHGEYLICQKSTLGTNYDVVRYTKNLKKLDADTFYDRNRGGFYSYDPEWGYYEVSHIAKWLDINDLEEVKEENVPV